MLSYLKNIINRDSIYVGEIVRPSSPIYRYSENHKDYMTHECNGGKLCVSSYFSYRSVLFSLNEEKLADDLLYKSPNYPIINMSDDSDCFDAYIVIINEYNLGLLLKYLGYKEKLSLQEVKKIRRRLFNGHFGKDHCELFGYKKNELGYYVAEELKNIFQRPLFPNKLMNVLNNLSDKSLEDVRMGFYDSTNAFKPDKEEGPIKKLSIF